MLNLGDNGYVRKFAGAGWRGDRIDALKFDTASDIASTSVFSYFGLNVPEFFLTPRSPMPLERTYLITGPLEAAMISRASGGEPVAIPHLEIVYSAAAARPRRPRAPRPTGASLVPRPVIEPGVTLAAQSIPINRDGTVRGRSRR